MLDRLNGKILHIDFGDCFEVAMTREKFPEKIPFRLTRMLINAMEVSIVLSSFLVPIWPHTMVLFSVGQSTLVLPVVPQTLILFPIRPPTLVLSMKPQILVSFVLSSISRSRSCWPLTLGLVPVDLQLSVSFLLTSNSGPLPGCITHPFSFPSWVTTKPELVSC